MKAYEALNGLAERTVKITYDDHEWRGIRMVDKDHVELTRWSGEVGSIKVTSRRIGQMETIMVEGEEPKVKTKAKKEAAT